MPMVAELPVTMLACARLGVIHTVVFGGFSGEAAGRRAADWQSRVLITMDGYYRNGKMIDHLQNADVACETAKAEGQVIDKVLIWPRYPGKASSAKPLVSGRDFLVNEVLKPYKNQIVAPVSMPSEAPLFLMYTSGTTGRPKGCQHSTGGYLAYAAGTSKWIQDIHPTDVYWCTADIGWITGHTYIVYGPLALGGTTVIYEGVPTFPDANRLWRIAERLGVNIFHTAPTAIRQLRKLAPDGPKNYRYEVQDHDHGGGANRTDHVALVLRDRGQGEGVRHRHVVADRNRRGRLHDEARARQDEARKRGSGRAGDPLRDLRRERERDPPRLEPGRNICVRNPWPGLMQTIWGDPERFKRQYFTKYNKNPNSKDWRDWPYFAGDGAMESADGYFRILGRID